MHAQTRRHRHIKENKTEALRALPWYCSDVRFRLIVFCVRPFKLNQQATTLKHPKKPQSYQEVLKSTTHWFNELRSQSSGAFSFECCDRTEIFFLRSVIMCVSYFGWINHQLIIPFSRLFLFSELAKWVYKMVWIDSRLFGPLSLSESPEAIFQSAKEILSRRKNR